MVSVLPEVHWVQPHPPEFVCDVCCSVCQWMDSWQGLSTDLRLSALAAKANSTCLCRCSSVAFLMGTLLRLGSVSADHPKCANCKTCSRANKIKPHCSHYCLFIFMDYAGGLCRLWLWEQAPRSYSFSSGLYEGCSRALTFHLHFRRNWKEHLWGSHNTILGTNVTLFYLFAFVFCQCIILRCEQYVLWENS